MLRRRGRRWKRKRRRRWGVFFFLVGAGVCIGIVRVEILGWRLKEYIDIPL